MAVKKKDKNSECEFSPPFCPKWSAISGKPTSCIKGNCTNWVFIQSEEVKKESGLTGFCRDALILAYTESITFSLESLAGISDSPDEENNKNEQLERSRVEAIRGYE